MPGKDGMASLVGMCVSVAFTLGDADALCVLGVTVWGAKAEREIRWNGLAETRVQPVLNLGKLPQQGNSAFVHV